MTMRRALTEIALALVAASACWPLFELSVPSAVGVPVLGIAVAAWLTGAALRRAGAPALGIVGAQISVVAAITLTVLVGHGGSLSPAGVREVASSAQRAANASVAPLPADLGVIVMLTLGAGVVALVVDYIGATAQTPALTVLPLAAPLILATTALGQTLDTRYFVAAAISWALLMLASGLRRHTGGAALARLVPAFALMTVAALVAALVAAPRVPHRATPALAQGGARGVDNSVDFTETLDLSKNLTSRNSAPVLVYTSEDPTPGPLRVTTSATYSEGIWRPSASQGPFTPAKASTPLPARGLEDAVPSQTYKMTATINGMKPPLVAVPTPLRAANFGAGNANFRLVSNSGTPMLDRPAPAYSVLFRELTAAARPSSNAKVTAGGAVTAADLDTAALPDAASTRLDALVDASGASATESRFDAAVRLQRYLRTDPSFRYSLTLEPTRTIDGSPLDPLANFLETRRGYCTQFATTMVMAARKLAIPARIAIGFLPGTENSDRYEVRAADAHAWPELYFPGLGWTRFEPTPGQRSGEPPPYAPERTSQPATSSQASTPSTSAAPRTSSVKPPSTSTAPTSSTSTRPAAPVEPGHSFPWRALLSVLAGLAVIGLLLSVLPLAGRRERGRLLRAGQRDEGSWHAMLWHLRDLGYAVRPNRSPRALADAFERENARASAPLVEALRRAAAGIEGARYAAASPRSLASACERVVRTAREDAPARDRLRAELWPASGRRAVARLCTRRRKL